MFFVFLVAHAMQYLLQNYRFAINVRLRVRNEVLKNAHVRAMCVRVCGLKIRRNSSLPLGVI